MTTQSFTLAQQAADVAYAMTLAETGDMAQAADDYKSVMSAYHAAQHPVYDAHSHAATVAARYAEAASPDPKYVSLPQLMGEATVYNDWETFIAACDDIDGYGMMGDIG